MTDLDCTGFLFRWDRPDVNAPGGVLSKNCIAVARSLTEANQLIADTVAGSLVGVQLLKSGPDVLAEAKQRGIQNGEARAL